VKVDRVSRNLKSNPDVVFESVTVTNKPPHGTHLTGMSMARNAIITAAEQSASPISDPCMATQ